MTVFFIDLENGSESADGLSWATAKLTPKSIPLPFSPGDEIRVAKSADPVLVGDATWTDGSTAVTLASSAPSLTTLDFVSRTSQTYWGEWPWHSISTISGTALTLNRPYRGPSGTFPLYSRRPARPTPLVGTNDVLIGFGSTGGAYVNGTANSPPADVTPITMSGGWDTFTGLRDGQTFVDGQNKVGVSLRATGNYLSISRFSLARFGTMGLVGFVSRGGAIELDNVLESASTGYVFGSGNFGWVSDCKINAICGHATDGLHIHTSWGMTVEIGKIFDNGAAGVSQNNDYMYMEDGWITIGEVAHCNWGIGGTAASFNFVKNYFFEIGSVHDCATGGMGLEVTGANSFHIGRAYNNSRDIDLSYSTWVNGYEDENAIWHPALTTEEFAAIPQTIVASRLESATSVYLGGLPLVVAHQPITAQASTAVGGAVTLFGRKKTNASTVNVTGSSGTIGTVSYPDDSHWEVSVSSISATTTFTVSDGTDSVPVIVLIAQVLTPPAAILALAASAPTLSALLAAPAAQLPLQGSLPTLEVVQDVVFSYPPSAPLLILGALPARALFDSFVALSPPAAEMFVTGVFPAAEVRAASRWASFGGKFRLADGREVPVRIFQ